MRPRFTLWFEGLSSPQNYSMFIQALSLLFGATVLWIALSIFLSMLGGPLVILLAITLVVTFLLRRRRLNQKERWINEGRCAACGYDLRATPDRCPECGRDASKDEPAWRKLRRRYEQELKLPTASPPSAQENRKRLVSMKPPEPNPPGT
jgi:hypothetical protein